MKKHREKTREKSGLRKVSLNGKNKSTFVVTPNALIRQVTGCNREGCNG